MALCIDPSSFGHPRQMVCDRHGHVFMRGGGNLLFSEGFIPAGVMHIEYLRKLGKNWNWQPLTGKDPGGKVKP